MKDAGKCWKCAAPMWLPDELYDAARRSPDISIFCGYGHKAHFAQGDTEEDKIRRERDRLKQETARLQESVDYQRERRQAAERQAIAYKGVATRIKNRAAAGVCPCCNRSFSALSRHMATKHPDFRSAEIIPLSAAS